MHLIKKILNVTKEKIPSPERGPDDYVDVFIHVPKTGGSVVRTVISQNYELDQMRIFPGDHGDYSAFMQGDGTFNKRVRLLHGHAPLGIENIVDTDNVRRVTMMRDPLSRLVSDYLFSMSRESGWHDQVMKHDIAFMDFVKLYDGIMFNAQSKWIGGIHPKEAIGMDDNELLARTLTALDKYLVVGVNEMLPETMLLFAKTLNWKAPVYKSVNVMPLSKRFKGMLTKDMIAEVEALNRVDQKVYSIIKERFLSKILNMGPSFWKAVEEVTVVAAALDEKRGTLGLKQTFVIGRDRLDVDYSNMLHTKAFLNSGEGKE